MWVQKDLINLCYGFVTGSTGTGRRGGPQPSVGKVGFPTPYLSLPPTVFQAEAAVSSGSDSYGKRT